MRSNLFLPDQGWRLVQIILFGRARAFWIGIGAYAGLWAFLWFWVLSSKPLAISARSCHQLVTATAWHLDGSVCTCPIQKKATKCSVPNWQTSVKECRLRKWSLSSRYDCGFFLAIYAPTNFESTFRHFGKMGDPAKDLE